MKNYVYADVLHQTKATIRMANAKMWWFIADLLGIPTALLGIWLNLDNVKSVIIALLAIGYLMLRLYYFWIQKQQAVREKEYDLWHKEMDKRERISKLNKSN